MDIEAAIRLGDKFHDIMTEDERVLFAEMVAICKDNYTDGALFSLKSEYEEFVDWCRENAPRVLKMEQPITEQQYRKLIKDFPMSAIRDTLEDMNNRKPLLKDYVSGNKTLRNWLKVRNIMPSNEDVYTDNNRPHGFTDEEGRQWNRYTHKWES